MPVGLITGGSAGFGEALAVALAGLGWTLVLDARGAERLVKVAANIGASALAGDVADPSHRAALAGEVERIGRLDLLVNNASDLGPSPLPPLSRTPLPSLERVFAVDVFAPLALTQLLLPYLDDGVVVNVSSDAAVEAYPGWGGYGSAKAALDHLTAVFGAEHASVRFYAFDPGDMNTAMHQAAFPGEDISDRPDAGTVVPALLRLIEGRPPSGRYRAADVSSVAVS